MKISKKARNVVLSMVVLPFLLGNSGCEPQDTAETKQARETVKLQKEANNRLGMPNITNFTERRFAKMLLELRDKETTTYTYYLDMHGNKHLICKSIGYGLPYSVQYTNPSRKQNAYGADVVLPQADPNGLYMPQGLSATFVMCTDSEGKIQPVYIEPEIIVSPFKLK